MLKAIVSFGLTRGAIILLSLLVFTGSGLIAFSKLNIEAYPNPAPVILEITAQAPGLSAEEMERCRTACSPRSCNQAWSARWFATRSSVLRTSD